MKARWEIRPGLVYDGEFRVGEMFSDGLRAQFRAPWEAVFKTLSRNLVWRSGHHPTREAAIEDARAHGITIED